MKESQNQQPTKEQHQNKTLSKPNTNDNSKYDPNNETRILLDKSVAGKEVVAARPPILENVFFYQS
jgi:hypothetical protein